MKRFLLIVCILIASKVTSQITFTNAQVFDFEIGDVFQFHESFSSSTGGTFPAYKFTQLYIGKSYSTSLDTIYYIYDWTRYQFPSCQTCQDYFWQGTDTIFITNLTQLANHENQSDNCLVMQSINSTAFCNSFAWELSPLSQQSSGCLEVVHHKTKVADGLGLVYSQIIDGDIGSAFYTTQTYAMTYYKKGTDSCGTFLNLKENELISHDINIFPNPAKDWVTIESNLSFETFSINDISGRQILQGDLVDNRIFIDNLPSGLFLLTLFMNNQPVHTLKIMKE